MSHVREILASISDKGTQLWVHCGTLHYRSPEGGLTSCEVDILKNHARDILPELTEESAFNVNPPAIASSSTLKIAPLTFQQEFAVKYAGGRFYKDPAVRIVGTIDIPRLSDSLTELVQRHEALRTRIVAIGTVLRQQIQRNEVTLKIVDAISSSGQNTEDEIQFRIRSCIDEWLQAAVTAFEAVLLKISEREHVLVILWDHLLQDPASEATCFRDLWRLYQAPADARLAFSSKETVQYSDYAEWQRHAFAPWNEKYGAYWERRLRGAVPLRLPIGKGLEEVERTAWLDVALSCSLSLDLHQTALRSGVPLPVLTLSLVSIAFRDWCSQDRFTIPMSFSGRSDSRYLEVIGYFPHILPLTIEVDDGLAFTDLCRSVSRQLFSAIERLTVGNIVGEDLQGLFSGPLFQWFPWPPLDPLVPAPGEWHAQGQALTIVPFKIRPRPRENGTRPISFSLRVAFWHVPQGIVGLAEYRTDLLSKEILQDFFRNVQLIGEQAVRDPTASVASLRR